MKKKTIPSRLRAAVYDRWLFSLGGGEQVAFAYAEVLRDLGYNVDLLTHKEIDITKAEAKMGVNLKGISLRYLPVMASREVAQYTEEYDVFVNTSYLDYFPNRSKFGVLSVFFPGQIYLSVLDYIKIVFVIPSFRRFFMYPTDFSGFRFDEMRRGRIYKWLGDNSRISFNNTKSDIVLTFAFQDVAFSLLDELRFYQEEKEVVPVDKVLNHQQNQVSFRFQLGNTANIPLRISVPNSEYAEKVALISVTIQSFRFTLYNLFKKFFPRLEMRLHGGLEITKRSDLETYDRVVSISKFVKKWTKNYWGLESDVLYPPVNTKKFSPSKEKKNWIIHIGRFFVTGHNKKQLDLAKVFTTMHDAGETGDWELHFIGSVHEGQKHQEYFDAVVEQAKGYPVVFHTDVSFDELRAIIEQGKIYWHATGLDENESRSPILMEHFGITTVEAMAAGCVPVVIGAGGQKEIVTEGSGYLWNSREELRNNTKRLLHDDSLLKKLREGAVQRAAYFDRDEFGKRFAAFLPQRP